MKLKKTIAAIAAAALTVSAISFAVLADEGDEPEPAAHTHSWSSWTANGASGHTRTCSGDGECDATEADKSGSHDTNGEDGACSVCGYKATTTTEPTDPVDPPVDPVDPPVDPVTPPSGGDENEGGDSSGATLAEVNTAIDKIAAEWDYSWVPVSELESWGAREAVKNIKAELERAFGLTADVSLVSYTVGENGKVTFSVKVTVGGEEATRDVTLQCGDDNASGGDVSDGGDEEETTTIPDPIVYTPGSSSASSSEAAEQVAESSKDVAASRKPDITVNAAESGVSSDIVAAFTSNKSAKTLTLKYSSTLKVAIAKADISDASANLDFSVSGEKFLSSSQVKKLGAEKVVQLDFVSTGKLDGVDKATIKSSVGMGYVGKTVTVYEMVNGKLVKVGVAKVNGAGIVKFDTDHLGQFVLAVK